MKISSFVAPLAALIVASAQALAGDPVAPRRSLPALQEGVVLPRAMTQTEKDWELRNPDLRPRLASVPPTGVVVGASEYRPMEAILLGYSGTNAWKNILAEMAKHITTTGNADVMVVVTSTAQRTDMTTRFTNAGANMSRVKSYIASLDSIWMRDYGPRFVYEGGVRVVVDSGYYSTRPNDDAIPSFMATQLGRPYYAMPLKHSGGNYHMDDATAGYASTLTMTDNPTMTETQIRDMFQSYYGMYTNFWTRLPSTVDGTGHVDMWFIPVSASTVIISDWPNNAGSAQDLTCDSVAATMQARGYTVVRVPARTLSGVHYTYINAVVCNDLVMIPSYTNTSISGWNAQALAAWQSAMPGKTVVQVNCENIISAAGAMHCIVMHYPASTGGNNPVVHVRTPAGGDSVASGQGVTVSWISDHVRAITSVDIALSLDGGQTFDTIAANEANDGAFAWTVPDVWTTQARLRVTARDAQGASGFDLNDANFAITGTQPRNGDLDGNGLVDAGDIAVLLLAFGDCAVAADCPADLDRNGLVDSGDIGVMLLLFGSTN